MINKSTVFDYLGTSSGGLHRWNCISNAGVGSIHAEGIGSVRPE